MLSPEKKDELLAYARKSLANWQAKPREAGYGPPALVVGAEELLALLEELNAATGRKPSDNAVVFGGQTFCLTDDEVSVLLQQAASRPLPIPEETSSASPRPEMGYEELARLHRLEPNPVAKARLKRQLDAVRQRETDEMIAGADALAAVAREFKPFGAHNRFTD